jgi:hypothetical protein
MKRRVDASAVDQDEQLVRALDSVEAARGHRILPGVDPLDLQVRGQSKRFGQRCRRGAVDVVAGDDEDRGRRPADRLRPLRGGADLELGELLDRQLAQVLDRLDVGGGEILLRGHRARSQRE